MTTNFLSKFKHCTVSYERLNYFRVPCTCFPNNIEGMKKFNEVYHYIKTLRLNKMIRTRSGGISVAAEHKRRNIRSYSVKQRTNGAGIEMVVVIGVNAWRFQWRQTSDHKGHFNFRRFLQMCKTHKIDITKYAVDNGEEIKKQITPAPIKLEHDIYKDHWFKNGDIHHIDIHSSYPAGLAKAFPEFVPLIKDLYRKRKSDDDYKNLMNHAIGFFQSKYVNFKYAKLSKAAIDYNNDRIKQLAKLIKKHKGVILLYNTDGIWYKGPIIESKDRGTGLGQWDYDYTNVKEFHIKSAGCFEFLDSKGNYVSKARGIQKELLHKMGDIDTVKGIRKFWFDEERGICYED